MVLLRGTTSNHSRVVAPNGMRHLPMHNSTCQHAIEIRFVYHSVIFPREPGLVYSVIAEACTRIAPVRRPSTHGARRATRVAFEPLQRLELLNGCILDDSMVCLCCSTCVHAPGDDAMLETLSSGFVVQLTYIMLRRAP